jgi:ribosome-binding factor A
VADQARARRLAVRIREIVANTLENQVKDPRLGMVTITDARLTPDLRDATLYYTVYGDDTVRAESAAALESARGVLRSQVGRQTGIKFTPTLAFIADVVPEQSKQIDELLAVAREADAGLAQVREGATYAGDPDPYRHEQDDLDEDGTEDGTAASTAGGTAGEDADGVTEVDAGRRAGHPSDS